jgi:hypothetical protein
MTAQQTQTPNLPIKQYIAKTSCIHCSHLNVCALYRAIAPLLQNWKDPPINPEDLAIICSQFLSSQITQALSNNLSGE